MEGIRFTRRALLVALAAAPFPACATAQPRGVRGDVPAAIWRAHAPTRGGADARVVIHLFSDYECPFCARFAPVLDQVLARYGDQVLLVHRDYPLAQHPHAMLCAEAAREVFAQQGNEGFWPYHDLLLQNRNALGREYLEQYAERLGLDLARFRNALDRGVHREAIRADMADADATGVDFGLPAPFINGRYYAGGLSAHEFSFAIDSALAG